MFGYPQLHLVIPPYRNAHFNGSRDGMDRIRVVVDRYREDAVTYLKRLDVPFQIAISGWVGSF